MSFPKEAVSLLKDRMSLHNVISQSMELRREGGSWIGLCPFHDEKTPSFHVFKSHYHCFGCGAHGDAIQFLREVRHWDFQEAVSFLAQQSGTYLHEEHDNRPTYSRSESRGQPMLPGRLWQREAGNLVERTNQALLDRPELLDKDKPRGLSIQSIMRFRLGWLDLDPPFMERKTWGLPELSNSQGQVKPLWLPTGILIPYYGDRLNPIKLKIRQKEPESAPLIGAKYIEVQGGASCASMFGDNPSVIVLVEAELDAMLVAQEASNLCVCVAMGGSSKKPDAALDTVLRQAKAILYSFDYDEAGIRAFKSWKSQYDRLMPWPLPRAKSPADAFQAGVDLRQWIQHGISQAFN